MIDDLARAFEKAHPAAYVDINWSRNAKILQLVRSGEADIAVAGKTEPDLEAHQVAWDGIAIMVNASNAAKEVTKEQVAAIFSGKVKSWSELGGPDDRIKIINRHPTQNLTYSFEDSLGIVGQIPSSAEVIGPEQRATNRVVGILSPFSAVTFMSLRPALMAVRTGAAVRLLPIDRVEPERPTVKDGRYTIRRPVLFLTRKDPNPTVNAFIDFARSQTGRQIIDQSYVTLDGTP
jgi:phosphate transport system substrate-binding protein